jgi:hypothetical protein
MQCEVASGRSLLRVFPEEDDVPLENVAWATLPGAASACVIALALQQGKSVAITSIGYGQINRDHAIGIIVASLVALAYLAYSLRSTIRSFRHVVYARS